ncbi:tRNA (adenine(22)-N(1))-methyltransferase TrmK [Vibrio sp. Y2-5]|uniref:tRNA (adenine(22)-N(1))-methyltransferase n=1 Tax=Vibrio sp. Y2-5 TaxID=2743977 RepID=UPI001661497B|nr:tRNA (adenine(22)-N(1))-methyltransferase TrmK [Vibrio sp. Y2-5]MBD0785741.1 tRNA (adenine(22)-N(1))-methyltransferase TrmK [Vibrio sp. Y2-5]
MKLSKRLKQIDQMITASYEHIWDCCCDHGFLGASLLNRQAANNIHFVDIVPSLMSEVESKLQRFYPNSESAWHTHCLDVAKLPLEHYSGKHLVIIAGVGGDLMMHFISEIRRQYSNLTIDFLLCPVHHQFALRQKLIELELGLIDEVLLEENDRFYEIIYVSTKAEERKTIAMTGSRIWHCNSEQQATSADKYLSATLNHYRRMQSGNSADVQHIINAYSEVKLEYS